MGLNPCSNGMKIELLKRLVLVWFVKCLNPCSNGMKIEFRDVIYEVDENGVLILVLME